MLITVLQDVLTASIFTVLSHIPPTVVSVENQYGPKQI